MLSLKQAKRDKYKETGVWPSLQIISKEIGLSPQTISEAIVRTKKAKKEKTVMDKIAEFYGYSVYEIDWKTDEESPNTFLATQRRNVK